MFILMPFIFVPTFGKEETNDGQVAGLTGRVQRELPSYLYIHLNCELILGPLTMC